ncbi:substrate-binding domain-containing protein [Alcaligenes aquatilis]|uniref:Phosphate-binding protein PstS n=1 Tax=Alcaligenes aquatilis TaxID=323284 RepID=A0A3G2HRH4_9BURK|nr:substrate-binding domain-containing protein [Alcaligenes aquatilis]AYN19511.1 alkaline phosphatase [Alcaligenes aquatilis]
MAQVVGGGSTLPRNLYNDVLTASPLPGFNTYIGVGSDDGKRAFFTNDGALFNAPGATVDYVGSDSLVNATEAQNYADNDELAFGPLIQIPSVLTSVTVPYNITGISNLNLTSAQVASVIADPAIVRWNQVPGFESLPNSRMIKVIYRSEGSGTTEVFLRHLNAVNSTLVPSVSNTFSSVIDVSNTNKYISVEGSQGMVDGLAGNVDSIGYVSPDYTDEGNNAVVARVNGLLPTQINPQAVIEAVPVPSTAVQRRDPLAWGISNPNPSRGYPIVGSTNLILSQCYQSATDNARIRDALNKLYGTAGTWDSQITAHGFIPLPAAWKTAIHQTFWNQADSLELAVGDPTECTPGRGRPQ